MMHKIAIIHNGKGFGGIENQILNLCLYSGDNNKFIYFTEYPNSKLPEELNRNGIEIFKLEGNFIIKLFYIKKICSIYKIDIIQTHTFRDSILYRLVNLLFIKSKFIFRVHTYIACSWIPQYKKNIYYFIDSITSFVLDAYIINGTYLKQEFLKNTFINSNKMYQVIDGIKAIDEYNKIHFTEENIDNVNLLMIANVIPHKGYDTLIKALKILKDNNLNVHCDCLGDYNRDALYKEHLDKMIADFQVEDNVNFIGFSRDVKSYILKNKIIVLPSDSEGTPNCIMEAMSVGRLVVVSETGGVTEMVKDKQTGFLHKPCDGENLAEKIKEIIKSELSELDNIASSGQKYWREYLSSDVMCVKFNDIYNNLLGK